jgi:hypothetical protein
MVSSSMFSVGLCANHTGSTPVRLINGWPQSKGLERHPLVPVYSPGT